MNDDTTPPQTFLEVALMALSHELRTPLAAAKGYATSLIRHDRRISRGERLEMLGEIEHACNRLETIIGQTLQTTRLLQGGVTLQCEIVDLTRLTSQVVKTLARTRDPQSPPISIECAETLLVWADAHWLIQVMEQLLDNARRFSPPDGQIIIALRHAADDGKDLVEWSVKDSGMGVAAEHLPHIFKPFYRTENHNTRAIGGLGLGLALCQHVIALHGGDIFVTSIPDEGSHFWFTLPLIDQEEKASG
jgi:signal transduction histidine kinase